jgi:hypothetical protein
VAGYDPLSSPSLEPTVAALCVMLLRDSVFLDSLKAPIIYVAKSNTKRLCVPCKLPKQKETETKINGSKETAVRDIFYPGSQ